MCKQSAARSRQITTPAHHHSIFTAWTLFLTPNQQCRNTERKKLTYAIYLNISLTIHNSAKHDATYIIPWPPYVLRYITYITRKDPSYFRRSCDVTCHKFVRHVSELFFDFTVHLLRQTIHKITYKFQIKNVLNYHIHVRHTTRTTTTVLRPLYRSTCVSQHLQLRTAGFSWCKVLLPANQRIRIREKTLEFSSTVLSTRCLYLNMSDIMHITYKLFRFRLI